MNFKMPPNFETSIRCDALTYRPTTWKLPGFANVQTKLGLQPEKNSIGCVLYCPECMSNKLPFMSTLNHIRLRQMMGLPVAVKLVKYS